MGSRVGYEYRYRFSMVDENEINSVYTLDHLPEGVKASLFDIRTDFILRRRTEEGVADAIMESERYDVRAWAHYDGACLSFLASYRLKEYWMTKDEINLLFNEPIAFAKQMAANPQHASLTLIPVVVSLEVCTVQQEGESFDACMERAISVKNLVPLYLWPLPTTVERKPMTTYLMKFLRNLPRIRVENTDEGLSLMQDCHICSRKAYVGAQITKLTCDHAFHSHCIVRLLEDNNLCPLCHSPAYDRCRLTDGSPYVFPRP